MFNFIAPWESKVKELMDSFDLVFSRAVMEHATDVDRVYSNIYSCLKHNGLMFHDIEYNSHHTSKFWNGHWGFSNFIWKLIEGKRPMIINRLPHSKHAAKIVSSGIKLIADSRVIRNSELPREWIAKKYGDLTDEDLCSYGGWFLAEKN
jgi:SAM-dependent methyltransferase